MSSLAGDDVRALVKVLLERFEITQVDLARETGLPHRQSIGLWLRGDKLAQEGVIAASKAVASWCNRFRGFKKGQARPLPAKVRNVARVSLKSSIVTHRGHEAEAGRLSLYVFHLPSLSTPHLPFFPMSHVTLLSKASVRVREVKSVEVLMERLSMSLADVAADCGILRCVAKKRPVLEVTDRHSV